MSRSAAVALLAFIGAFGSAQAEMLVVKADLSAAQEAPPTDSKGKGTLKGAYDTTSKTLTYSVTYSELTGAATAAHFHGPAATGKNAPVILPAAGSIASPIEAKAVLDDTQAKALTEGMLYFNIHTAANKGGEIRGQISAAK